MAAGQSTPLWAPLGLLLLLIGVISSHIPDVQGRPIDFWCNRQARKSLENGIAGLKEDMANCSDTLPSPVQLPNVGLNQADWKNKTNKHEEVLGALQVFRDGVQGAKLNATLQCQTSLLEKLEHHTENYLRIVNRLQIQKDTISWCHPVVPSHSAAQHCSNETSLKKVLEQYRSLLLGKLWFLVIDLHDHICQKEHGTTNTSCS
ncbi:uncharacterized protein LOC121187460 isoform X2 [Toxotes jaculatrix]|uniref:uncharacterized protein LOC121187460 isoform X2 n=1 Tax=Toxotes jaculatrix TaxID=941984 RepID=UPI001B3B002C|nr:uncharacterized protein LOC121187460 isoform X2 [Toxotes jaculatrix]